MFYMIITTDIFSMEGCEGWTLMTHTWQKIHLRYSVIYMYMYMYLLMVVYLASASDTTRMYYSHNDSVQITFCDMGY